MAKKNVEDAQPKAVAEAGSQEESQKGQEQQAQKAKVTTTEGNTIDKIRVFQKDGNGLKERTEHLIATLLESLGVKA